MNLRHFLSKQSINHLSRLKPRKSPSPFISSSYTASAISAQASPSPTTNGGGGDSSGPLFSTRQFHSTPQLRSTTLADNLESAVHDDPEEADDTMNEFLSRFVYIMRGKLTAAYPDSDKNTVNAMLLVIVEKVVAEMEKGTLGSMLGEAMSTEGTSNDFSDDLWRTVWEVSNTVCEDMDKQRKKEQMKKFLQSEEVKKMARFASEAGIRGDMLRELKFKWAREEMEKSEFYESLKELKEEEVSGEQESGAGEAAEKGKFVGLPKRKGKIKYKIYGLDLSDPKWKEAADKIHEAGEVMWPKEAKSITGKCKLVTEKILSVEEEDDLSPLLAEWVELLKPSRVDWESLLKRLQERSIRLYYKAAEHLLDEPSFETNIHDFSKLIGAYAKEGRMEDAERILAKMDENGIQRDIPTLIILVHMYTKAGDIDRAKQAFETLKNQGFRPDVQVYSAMIMACANAGEPRYGESLQRDMEARDIKSSEEIYLALLRAYAKLGDYSAAQRISIGMQFANIQPTAESCTLLLEACGLSGKSEEVMERINTTEFNFDNMIKVGIKPDDKSVAVMVATYKRRNLLDKALDLLMLLEKQGFEPGMSTYTALLDWLAELQLVDEAEQVLDKISHLGETPPLKIHVILCDMYSRAKVEKKALQALGVLEAKKDQLTQADFERVIRGLKEGKFIQDAHRMLESMEALGFTESVPSRVFMMATPSN